MCQAGKQLPQPQQQGCCIVCRRAVAAVAHNDDDDDDDHEDDEDDEDDDDKQQQQQQQLLLLLLCSEQERYDRRAKQQQHPPQHPLLSQHMRAGPPTPALPHAGQGAGAGQGLRCAPLEQQDQGPARPARQPVPQPPHPLPRCCCRPRHWLICLMNFKNS